MGTLFLSIIAFRGRIFTTEDEEIDILKKKKDIMKMHEFSIEYFANKMNLTIEDFLSEYNKSKENGK